MAAPGTQSCQTDGTSVGRTLEEGRRRNRDPKSKKAKCKWITTPEPKLAQRMG